MCRWPSEGCWGAYTLTLAFASSSQTLKTLRQVEVINFGDCLVRSKGAVAIADAVRGGLPKLKVPAPPVSSPRVWASPTLGVAAVGGRGVVFKARWAWVCGSALPHLSHFVQFSSRV